ncbi:hypothetical protein [Flavobacterium sp. ZS1P14]|uniref:hypothetical protein n=1 Tax=Flavobacterium sp. ZS1P14 TaxID=3401729 RepID=UPI003AAC718E
MKKILFIGLVLGILTICGFIGNEQVTVQVEKQTAAKMEAATKPGPDCQTTYARKCNFGNPLLILPGQITSPTDVENYCRQTSISCPVTECVARLNVMYGFLPGSPKVDSCLPAGYRGK